jgi:threonine synthase
MYISTRANTQPVPSYEAIYLGMAPQGGLFVPEKLPKLSVQEIGDLEIMDYPGLAYILLSLFLDDYPIETLADCAEDAYGEQTGDDEVYSWEREEERASKEPEAKPDLAPVKMITDRLGFLELFHGPTAAFKDMALLIMPHLLIRAAQKMGKGKEILILVATSGDTGKAALEGFKNVPGIKIIVFYPHGGVSPLQEAQMMATDGDNTYVCAVEGNFDDCQNAVKAIFADPEMVRLLEAGGIQMSSANSINWGRLAPQIVYYFHAYLSLYKQKRIVLGEPVNFTVPTGNFGNILAGWYAKRMGLPIHKLICASNTNKVLTDFFRTGTYDRKRPFYKTNSPSMDILISSNLERFLFEISGHNGQAVQGWMDALAEEGRFQVGEDVKKAMDETLWAGFAADEDGSAVIRKIYEAYHYVMDPHTAVGMAVYEQYRRQTGDETLTLIVATASPFKFGHSVLAALDDSAASKQMDAFEILSALSDLTGEPVHPALSDLKERPRLPHRLCRQDEIKSEILSILNMLGTNG